MVSNALIFLKRLIKIDWLKTKFDFIFRTCCEIWGFNFSKAKWEAESANEFNPSLRVDSPNVTPSWVQLIVAI